MAKILDRMEMYALSEGFSIGALERQLGMSKGVLSRAIAKGTDIQAKWLESMVENYPDISAEWLLRGEGEMIKPKGTTSNENADPHTSSSCKDTQNSPNMQDNSEFSAVHKQLLDALLEKTEEIGRLKEQIYNLKQQYSDNKENHISLMAHEPETILNKRLP